MRVRHLLVVAAAIALLTLSGAVASASRCTGEKYCKVCTDCSRCRHCHVLGHTCGVCAHEHAKKPAKKVTHKPGHTRHR